MDVVTAILLVVLGWTLGVLSANGARASYIPPNGGIGCAPRPSCHVGAPLLLTHQATP